MLSSSHFFDGFPVELLHNLFEYFAAHEILISFMGVCERVDDILRFYSNYKLNFKSIRKDHFDLVCRSIQPEQVISLTLCDDSNTPGQSKFFFSRFHIQQFIQLQSLRLIDIEPQILEYIIPNLWKMNHLRSLCLKGIHWRNSLQSNNYTQVASRLNRLHLYDEKIFNLSSYPNLHHLKVNTCAMDRLEIIFQHASQLRSLEICLENPRLKTPLIFPLNHLIRLNLEPYGKSKRSPR